MKIIKLSKGQECFVDDEDFEWLNLTNWYALFTSDGQYYAVKTLANKRLLYMARVIMKTPSWLECDHINGMKNNNQKYNLRNVTMLTNRRNKHKYVNAEQKRIMRCMKDDGWTSKEIEKYMRTFVPR